MLNTERMPERQYDEKSTKNHQRKEKFKVKETQKRKENFQVYICIISFYVR